MSTLIQLRTDVVLQGFDQTRLGTVIDAKLNEAKNRVARRLRVRTGEGTQAFTTVAGTSTLTIPTDFVQARSMLDSGLPRNLKLVELTDMDVYPVSSGRPRSYAISGSTLVIYPTPDAAYSITLRYWKTPPDLVNDSDTPAIPADYHDLLATWAKARLYEYEDDAQMAQYFQQKYTTDLNAAAADLQTPDAEATQVPSMWDVDGRVSGQWYPAYIDSGS